MKLTENDYYNLASQMNDKGCIELERDGELLTFDYNIESSGYDEDDYYNGTGAHITTDVVVRITEVACVNEDGESVECDFDANYLEKIVEQSLLTL